ncbi:GyrI-like domain-containing protein [Nocardioides sp. TF02-7]|uniref:GyrI-like domain-containing protein n=1 Tax=Nocardioides sp. TF02-7 TaxID=2917724 RepID=UPI001F070770|nr:GyrI-like domain-containing protein [Nocardioides sp. TF02-7]UMG92660.1 GyrI-like domain-containing protein [Nocardioides sp. TF02-7]
MAEAAAKTDFKKTLDSYRARAGEFRVLEVPPMRYLAVDGRGDPNTAQEYADALAALYPVAYRLKFASKRELGRDYVVPPLEALWWADDMAAFTSARDKSRWEWTAMLMVPDWVADDMVDAALAAVAAGDRPAPLDEVRLELLDEGLCVQTLHVGSYDDETATLADLHDRFIPEAGLRMTGRHHEIYLSDPRRVEPSRLRTILRQPVARVG